MNQQEIQKAQKLALLNIIKYVCRVAGTDFLSKDDKTIEAELATLTSKVKNSINDK